MSDRWWPILVGLVLALTAGCDLLEVPYVPRDGAGGFAGVGGTYSGAGGDSWHVPSGGGEATASGASRGYGGEPEPEAVVSADLPIRGLGVKDEYVYWMTAGTRTDAGKSRHDGAIFRMGVNGGLIETAAAMLDLPTRMEMTDTAAYIWAESQSVAYVGFLEFEFASTIVSGVAVGASAPVLFAAFADRAYVSHDLGPDSGVFEHRLGGAARRVIDGIPKDIAVDAEHIYYATAEGELFRVSLADPSSSQKLASDITGDFALWQDQVLVIRDGKLAMLPKTGGELTDRLPLQAGRPYYELRVAGDRYFASRYEVEDMISVYTGLVSRGDCEWVWTYHWDDVWVGLPDVFYAATSTFIQRKWLD